MQMGKKCEGLSINEQKRLCYVTVRGNTSVSVEENTPRGLNGLT
jgi:hypothetical protein